MKVLISAMYLAVSVFFMLSLHAETLDEPTLVFKVYNEHFAGKHGVAGFKAANTVSDVKFYLASNMKGVSALKIDRLSRLIVKLGRQFNLQPGLILSVIKVESNFRSWAISPRGALGLMQVMPETGEWLAERYDIEWRGPASLLDEETNTLMGVRYLAYLKAKYNGDLGKTLSAYNRGPAKVDEEVNEGRMGTLGYFHKIREYFPVLALAHPQDLKIAEN